MLSLSRPYLETNECSKTILKLEELWAMTVGFQSEGSMQLGSGIAPSIPNNWSPRIVCGRQLHRENIIKERAT
jgi:hypothetical protein